MKLSKRHEPNGKVSDFDLIFRRTKKRNLADSESAEVSLF